MFCRDMPPAVTSSEQTHELTAMIPGNDSRTLAEILSGDDAVVLRAANPRISEPLPTAPKPQPRKEHAKSLNAALSGWLQHLLKDPQQCPAPGSLRAHRTRTETTAACSLAALLSSPGAVTALAAGSPPLACADTCRAKACERETSGRQPDKPCTYGINVKDASDSSNPALSATDCSLRPTHVPSYNAGQVIDLSISSQYTELPKQHDSKRCSDCFRQRNLLNSCLQARRPVTQRHIRLQPYNLSLSLGPRSCKPEKRRPTPWHTS